jgi:hypothetical protein
MRNGLKRGFNKKGEQERRGRRQGNKSVGGQRSAVKKSTASLRNVVRKKSFHFRFYFLKPFVTLVRLVAKKQGSAFFLFENQADR